MVTKKIYEFNGRKYHPFSHEHVWVYNDKQDRWAIILMPSFLKYIPDEDKLIQVSNQTVVEILDCLCDSLDLFRYGCRC